MRLEPDERGRMVDAFRRAGFEPGPVVIDLFDREGRPWMVHPTWGSDPATPAVLTADYYRGGEAVVDRAVDLRLSAWRRAEGMVWDSLRQWSDWGTARRLELGYAVISHAAG